MFGAAGPHAPAPWIMAVAAGVALLVLVWAPGTVLLLALLALFLSKPDPSRLPSLGGGGGVLGAIWSAVTGAGSEPEVLDFYLCSFAVHRDHVFLGVAGMWIEVPKAWWGVLCQLLPLARSERRASTPVAEDAATSGISAETEARRLKQQKDFAGAAAAFEDLATAGAAPGSDLEIGTATAPRIQHHASQAAECWLEAGRPALAVPHLRRALNGAVKLQARLDAAEALAQAAADLAASPESLLPANDDPVTLLSEACASLFAVAAVEPASAHLAARAVAKAARRVSSARAKAGDMASAARALQVVLSSAAEALTEDEADEASWLRELDCCVSGLFLATMGACAGDAASSLYAVEPLLQRLPRLVAGPGAGFALDVARAAEDLDVNEFQEICERFDTLHGPLEPWQLDALISLKQKLCELDLT